MADLRMTEKAIEDAGADCTVTHFVDGAEVLAYLYETTSPVSDLIVLDLNLPKVEGASVLSAVRSLPRWSKVPVLVFTSSTAPADRARINALGADGYLVKPSNLDEFLKIGFVIKDWLEKRPNTES